MNQIQSIFKRNTNELFGDSFVLCVEENVDASFLIHHFLSLYSKNDANVCFLSLSQTFHHYNSVAKKLGLDLSKAQADGKLIFLNCLQEGVNNFVENTLSNDDKVSPPTSPYICLTGRPETVDGLFKLVISKCKSLLNKNPDGELIIIIDNLTILLALGIPVQDVVDLNLYLSRALKKLGTCCLFAVITQDQDEDTEFLSKQMRHYADYVISVQGLSSGHSKDVHGQMTVEHRTTEFECGNKDISVLKLHYKITDKNVSFFAIGTSSAVL